MMEIEKVEVCPECSGELRQREYLRIEDILGDNRTSFDLTIYCTVCGYSWKETPCG